MLFVYFATQVDTLAKYKIVSPEALWFYTALWHKYLAFARAYASHRLK